MTELPSLQGRFCVVPMMPASYAQHVQIFVGLAAAPLQVTPTGSPPASCRQCTCLLLRLCAGHCGIQHSANLAGKLGCSPCDVNEAVQAGLMLPQTADKEAN